MRTHVNSIMLSGALLLSFGCIAHAAEKVKPYPHYWMSVATVNQSIPGMSEEMAGMAALFGKGPGFGPRRELRLQLESPRQAPAKPEAAHEIPPGQQMGTALTLVTPLQEKHEPVRPEHGDMPEKFEKPKGRMLLYWGCGDTIAKGQPRVFDAARMKPEEMAGFFKGRKVTRQTAPSAHSGWVYGEWPNRDERKDIPRDSSLVGEQLVKGNYVPNINFSLGSKHDFMAPVEFTSLKSSPSGAMKVDWKAVPTAIGYFASAVGSDQKTGDMIFWSSSDVQEMGSSLMDYLTPGDISRFIREKVVMDPSRNSCTVPPVFKEVQGAMLQFIAYGEQLDIVYPPKPKDPKQLWQPQWSVKVRLKSTGMTMLGESSAETGRPGKGKRSSRTQDEAGSDQSKQSDDDSDSGKSGGGVVDRMRGLFGF